MDSLAAQSVPEGCAVQIVVVDNDEHASALSVVESFAAASPYPIHYVHEPVRGIARARNAILDKATALGAKWIAMLDDDETAAPNWVDRLMATEYRNTHVLMGRRIWVYPNPRPFWAPDRDREPRLPVEGGAINVGSTCNVRLSMALVHAGLRFDENMGLGGGSDQRYFSLASHCGFAIHVTNRAITFETVHPERLTYRFLIFWDYAHHGSLAFRQREDQGVVPLLALLLLLLPTAPVGLMELAVSPVAGLLGRRHFKQFALRGGKRLARLAGIIVVLAGHLPQPYRHVLGH